jgi:phospholipid transport system substrate-binding protein
MIRIALTAVLLIATWAAPSLATELESDAEEARRVVQSLQDELISCMKEADTLGFEGRAERIGARLPMTYDLTFAARAGIGPMWKELTPEQQREFTDLNRQLTAARYASNFDGYGGQTFETRAVTPAARGTIIVQTELVQKDDPNVRFDYRLRKRPAGWRIIDVVIDNAVSEFVLWRGQFRNKIENEGYDKLVEAMKRKINELSRD